MKKTSLKLKIIFCIIFTGYLIAFDFVFASTNLLTNGDFETGDSTGWTIIDNGGSGATFGGGVYATSYAWNSISQTVDLVGAGYSEATLDSSPNIVFDVITWQRFDHDGEYYLEYKLLASDGITVVTSSLYGSSGSPIYLSANTSAFSTTNTFSNYGSGVRYAYIKIAGRDGSPDWGGQYGPYFNEASITLSDTTAPAVSSLLPVDDATGVSITSTFEITFDEDITTSTGNVVIYKTSDDSLVENISVTSSLITASGTTALVIDPSIVLDGETEYYIMIDATAIDDTSSNSYAGITASTTWSFTTEDTPSCPTIANAATYNSYPTCGAISCDSGYRLSGGSCVVNNGGGSAVIVPAPTVGFGSIDSFIDMGKTLDIGTVNSSGINIATYINSPATFKTLVSNNNKYISQQHKIEIIEFDLFDNILTLEIKSESKIVNLQLGEYIKIDLDNDNILDIEIKFEDIIINRAELSVTSLLEEKTDVMVVSDNNEIVNNNLNCQQSYNFTKSLSFGDTDYQVLQLQKYLNDNNFTISQLGAGSTNNETEYFGNLTKQALIKFQNQYKDQILKPSGLTQGTGYFGPSTIKYINTNSNCQKTLSTSLSTPSTPVVTLNPSGEYTFTKYLYLNDSGEEVKQLQLKLTELGFFDYSGGATGYFGDITKQAVIKFQKAKNLTPFPGWVGPGTRAELNK